MGGPIGQITTMRRSGSMIETPRFPPFLTARQVLGWLATAHGLSGDAARIDGWLDRVGLTGAANRKVRGFSVGMMQRLRQATMMAWARARLCCDSSARKAVTRCSSSVSRH